MGKEIIENGLTPELLSRFNGTDGQDTKHTVVYKIDTESSMTTPTGTTIVLNPKTHESLIVGQGIWFLNRKGLGDNS